MTEPAPLTHAHKPCCAPARGAADGGRGAAPAPVPTTAPAAMLEGGLVGLPGGTFWMGCDRGEGHPLDREGPAREVTVGGFSIAACAVTNQEFSRFVEATGYLTEAEQFGWSFVFDAFLTDEAKQAVRGHAGGAGWWLGVDGACWSRPFGPGSTVAGLEDHPVVHVSWHDADAYCAWAGARLPTEAEWEYAARGGLERKRFPWGDELKPGGRWNCNIWQGAFPGSNTEEDGYRATAPVGAYEPNGYGLYQTVGNVWEWCDTAAPGAARVVRGGSYLCHDSYCNRYRVAARSANTPDSSGGNLGFRCARDR